MSALRVIEEAIESGVSFRLNGDNLTLKATIKPPADLLAKLNQHKAEIVALFQEAAGQITTVPVAPVPSPWPEPVIIRDPNFAFGADQVPQRYRRAWRELLARCPAGVSEWVWAQAIYDARDFFETWGAKIEEMRWHDDEIFERPDGLIWFLAGEYVTFPGGTTAHTSGKRIWRRPRP